VGDAHQLGARADAELAEDLVEVVGDGPRRDEQPGGDLAVADALADGGDDLRWRRARGSGGPAPAPPRDPCGMGSARSRSPSCWSFALPPRVRREEPQPAAVPA
jgi:hypothetical protein